MAAILFACRLLSQREQPGTVSAAESLEEPTAAAPATGAVEKPAGAADSGATSDVDSAKLAKRVERFGRIAPITENEAAEKMAKRKAKFGLPEKVIVGILVHPSE